MSLLLKSLPVFIAALMFALPAAAEPTDITVRVIAQDAKFVGSEMGGARVTLRDAATGALLASGTTTGGTGNTKQIMTSQGRSPLRATPDAAAFKATIDLSQPTLITAEVTGPLGQPQSAMHVTSQHWVMPGDAVTTGDGWTVELPGLAVNIATPLTHSKLAQGTRDVAIKANVMLNCGCPITPGGLWDAKDYGVTVTAYRAGNKVLTGKLDFVDAPGHYAGSLTLPGKGVYELVVFAKNRQTGNAGLARTTIILP